MVDSKINGSLEIFWENGKKVLNGAHSNYSFGRLHQVFSSGFRHFNLPWGEIQEVLILGYGGGSIAELVKKQRQFNGNITAVEIDPVIRDIAMEHFPEALSGVELHIRDARDFLSQSPQRYDLIAVDLFVDDRVPAPFKEEDFIMELKAHLNLRGIIIHNFMFTDEDQRNNMMGLYHQYFHAIDHMELFGSNTLIAARKN